MNDYKDIIFQITSQNKLSKIIKLPHASGKIISI